MAAEYTQSAHTDIRSSTDDRRTRAAMRRRRNQGRARVDLQELQELLVHTRAYNAGSRTS